MIFVTPDPSVVTGIASAPASGTLAIALAASAALFSLASVDGSSSCAPERYAASVAGGIVGVVATGIQTKAATTLLRTASRAVGVGDSLTNILTKRC